MRKAFLGSILLIVLCLTCSKNDSRIAGGATDSPNASVVACVVLPDGTPAVGSTITLRQSDYVTQPPASLGKAMIYSASVKTDARGRFEIDGIEPGAYDIEVSDPSAGSGQGYAILLSCSVAKSDTMNLGTDTLRPYASVQGTADTTGMSGKKLFVQVVGLERLIPVDSAGKFQINDLPAGLFSMRVITVDGSQTILVGSDQVIAVSGTTVPVTMSGWVFAKKLVLNTAAGGANVQGNTYNFPVLVRLTSTNFDFSQAQINGNDLRFTKSNGNALPFEIERWDAAHSVAEIWVKVDTVYGNSSTQGIIMYWGNVLAGRTISAPVFDTTDGNMGVWHLGPGLGDATVFGAKGVDSVTSDADGIIGRCRHFDPARRSFITIPNAERFNMTSTITLSAWVMVDSFAYEWPAIITKGDDTYRLHCDTTAHVAVFSLKIKTPNPSNDISGTTVINDHRWHQVCGVYDGSVMRMYTDGVLNGELVGNAPLFINDSNIAIGDNRSVTPRFFAGSIDEVRIMNAAMDDDWVKLCYMNQKQDDALVVFPEKNVLPTK